MMALLMTLTSTTTMAMITMKKIMMYSVATGKSGRPPRPMLQLAVPANQLEASHGQVILMVEMNMVII